MTENLEVLKVPIESIGENIEGGSVMSLVQ